MTLFELTQEMQALEAAIESAEGELTDEQDALHNFLLDAREAKIEAYVSLIRNFESLSEAREAEAKRIRALASSDEKKANRLKQVLLEHLETTNTKKVQTPRFSIHVRKKGGPPAVIISPEAEIPEQFLRTTVTVKPDAEALRNALKNGQKIDGITLAEKENTLTIK